MKKITLFICLLAMAGTMFIGCKDALDITPRQSIDAASALTTKDGINAAVASLYTRLKGLRVYGRDFIAFPEALADNGFAANRSGRLLNETNNVFRAHFIADSWNALYAGINQANLILETVPTVEAPGITAADKNTWMGEMYFMRGLYHFNIALAYAYIPGAVVGAQDKGGIPIILQSTADAAAALALKPSRAPINDVYAAIVSDLEKANLLLSATASINLANKVAAQGLLSRVNLYRKDYTAAKKWADSCITLAGNRLATSSNYVNQWRVANHTETLFQVVFTTNAENNGVNESLQTSFTTLVTPGNPLVLGGFGDLVPSVTMLNALGITLVGGNSADSFRIKNAAIASRTADVRNLLYEPGSTGRGGKSYVECTKFIGKNGFINLDNIPIIRISEVYLNRAEAMATPGSPVFNATAAQADLNTIATNRGLPAFALSGTALYDEILNQRRIEFAFEGHRFWDLKRLGKDLVKAPHYSTVAFTDIKILAPLPTAEIDGNKNLVQNPGY